MPNRPNAHSDSAIRPPENTRSRNSRNATIGVAVWFSIRTNSRPSRAAAANDPRISGEVQPLSWPSMSA